MSRQSSLSRLALSFLLSLSLGAPAMMSGATLIWDADTVTTGPQDGGGAWTSGGTTFWNTSSSSDVATTSADIAQFGASALGSVTSGGTVNISTQTIAGLDIESTGGATGYTLTASTTGQILTIGASGIAMNAGAQATTIGSANLSITTSASQSWLNNSSNTLTITGAITPLAASTLTLGGSGNINITATTPASNTALITKTGSGTVTWTADINTTGTLTINDGLFSLVLSSTQSSDMTSINVTSNTAIFRVAGGAGLSSATVMNLATGATYQDNFSGDTIAGLTGTGIVTTTNTSTTVNLNLSSSTNRTFDGIIQDNGTGKFAITKQGTNTATFTGSNTYTGGTTISQGTLALDFSATAGVGSTSNILSSSGAVTLASTINSGGLSLIGAASESDSQTVNGLTVSSGINTITLTPGSGGSVTLSLGALTRTGGSLNFSAPAATITTSNSDGLLGAWATYTSGGVTTYAKVTGGAISAATPDFIYQTATNISNVAGYSATGLMQVDNTSTGNVIQTSASTTALGSIQVTDTASRTFDVGSGSTLQFGSSGGLLVSTAASVTVGTAVDSGTITAGASGAAELTLQTTNAASIITVNSTIANNAGAGAVALTVNGPGRVVLAGTNTFTGAVTVLTGALEVQNSSGLGTAAGGVVVNATGALELSNNVTIGAEALSLQGTGTSTAGALRNISGNNSFGGAITLNATSTIGSTAGTLTLGGAINVGGNSVTFTGAGNFIVNGIITQSATNNPAFTKGGAGTLTLNAANALGTGTGAINIDSGTLQLGNTAALSTTRTINISTTNGAGTLRLSTDTTVAALITGLSSNNSATIISDRATTGAGITHVLGAAAWGNNTVTISAGPNVTSGTAGVSLASLNLSGGAAGTVTLNPTTANVTIVGAVNIGSSNFAKTLKLDGTSSGNVINGVISNNLNTLTLTKSNTSTWTLTNTETYTGATSITGGTLVLGNGANLGATAISVSSGATLAVTPGTTGANTAAGSTLTLSAGSILTMNDGATSNFNVAGTATMSATDVLNFDLGGATSAADKLAITGAVTTGGGVINITGIGSTALSGTSFTLITAASGLGPSGSFTLGNTNVFVGGGFYTLSLAASTATTEILTATAVTGFYWTGSQDASWSTVNAGNTNFATDSTGATNTNVLPSSSTNVFLTAASANNLSTTLDNSFTVNSLLFTGTGTANTAGFTIASGGAGTNTLTINATTSGNNPAGNGITVGVGAGADTISANVILGASQTWTINNAVTAPLTVSGGIGEASAGLILTKAGTGALTLSGNNTFTGGINMSAGVLNINGVNALGTGTFNISGASTIDNTSGAALTVATSTPITLGANLTFSTAAGTSNNNLNLGTGSVSITANRTITLNGTATTLTFGGTASNTTTAAQTLTVNGAGNTLVFNNGFVLQSASGSTAITDIFNGTGNITVNGVISNGPALANGVTYSGTGTMTLTGANTFTGKITVSSGVLSIASIPNGGLASPLGQSSNAAANVVIGATGTLQYTGATATTDRAFTSSSGGKVEVTLAGTNLTVGTGAGLSGTFTKTGLGTLTMGGSADNASVSATVSAGTLVLGKTSSGTVHAIGGTLTIAGGTAQLAGSGNDQIVDTSNVVINSGTLDMNGKPETINALSGTGGTITNTNATAATLTYSAFSGSTSYLGTITDGVGKVAITKTNASTLTLGGTGSSVYSGATTLAGGSLILDYTAGSTNLIGDGSAVVLGSTTLPTKVTISMTGAVANETIASIAVNANNTANIIMGSANEKLTITSATVTMGANSYLNFNTSVGGANGSTNTLGTDIVAWNPTLTNGIINPGITVTDSGGTGFATVVSGNVVRLGGASLTLLPPSGATTANNYLVDNNTGGSSAPGSNSLMLSADEGASTITVDTSARSGALDLNGHVLTSNGWTVSGSNDYQITNTGAATAALKSSTSGTSIVLNNFNGGAFNINAAILANGASGLVINGTGTTTFSGPANASTYTGNTVVNGGNIVVASDNAMSASTAVVLGNNTTSVSNIDLSGANQKIAGLTVSSNNATANTITVGSGKTLTITGAVSVGTDGGNTTTTKLVINGTGSLLVTPSAAQNFVVGLTQANQSYNSTTTVDLSSLSSVTLGTAANPIGTLNVAFGQTVTGILTLSNTANAIVASTIQIGHSNGLNANTANSMTLGVGTNTISADAFNIGLSKSAATVGFVSQTAGSPGTVVIGGKTTSTVNMTIGSNNGTATAAIATGTLELRGHNSTVTAGVVSLGISSNTSSGGATGTINFDTGTFTANGLTLGSKAGTAGTGTGSGTINLSGGTFTLGTGGFTMATNSAATGAATGLLNITGGTFTSNSDILKGGGTGTTATVTLNGGTLDMAGKSIGSSTQTVVFNANVGTLSNLNELDGGAALNKNTAGALVVTGTNNYTGATNVTLGSFQVGVAGNGTVANSVVTVNGAGTVLAGTGAINTATTITLGTVKPGDATGVSTGTLTVNNSMSVATAAGINLDVGAAAPNNDKTGLAAAITGGTVAVWAVSHGSDPGGSSNDLLKVTGTLTLGGTGASGSVVVVNAASPSFVATATFGDYFNLLDWSGTLGGTFTTGAGPQQGAGGVFGDLTLPTLTNGNVWDVSQFSNTGLVFVVPEPSRFMLAALGVMMLGLRRRRSAVKVA